MVYTLDSFCSDGVLAVTYFGVLWLIISSLICRKNAKPATPGTGAAAAACLTASFEVEPSPEPVKLDNLSESGNCLPNQSSWSAPPPVTDVESAALSAAAEPLVATPAPAKPRMYFLDNLKAFLTVVVICHHVIDDMRGTADTSAAFVIVDANTLAPLPKSAYSIFADTVLTLNQSYFMALFFFISGYFTPSSLDRKGVVGFLRDRFKRIGIPAVVYSSVFGPFQVWLTMAIGKNDPPVSIPYIGDLNNTYEYKTYIGQAWFLYWLVLLSFIYAFAHKEPLKLPCPQVGQIFLFAFGTGIWFVLKPYGGYFAMVPGGIHSVACYIAYFFAGIVAKRNDWMSEIMNLQTVGGKAATFFLWGLTSFLAMGAAVFFYSVSGFQSDPDRTEANKSYDMFNLSTGIFAVVVCLAEFQLFYVYFNKGGRVSKFFCKSAYGAYIIHFMFVNLGINVYFRLIRQFSGLPSGLFVFWQAGFQGTSHVVFTNLDGVTVSEKYTWFGMLFVCAFGNLCCWPTAFVLSKLPLFNQVL